MNPRQLDLAAEFCSLAGTDNLVAYLGLSDDCSAEEACTRLRDRRRYMQGMQANPKYRQEAIFLIRHVSTFEELLADPTGYLIEVRQREESAHLPILEMSIRGALKGGSLSMDQEDYLRRNARELGVTMATFEETLAKVAEELGVDWRAGRIADPFAVLGLGRSATLHEVERAFHQQVRAADELSDPEEAERRRQRAERAVSRILELRPDLNLRSSGGRTHMRRDDAPTAPPVRHRSIDPSAPRRRGSRPKLSTPPAAGHGRTRPQILGDAVRQIRVRNQRVTTEVQVRLTGEGAARVSTDQPWLIAEPSRLPAGAEQVTLKLRIDPQGMLADTSIGTLTVQTEQGERANVGFEVIRVPGVAPPMVIGSVMLVACVSLAAIVGSLAAYYTPLAPTSLTINVDPVADAIRIEGVNVGSGTQVRLDEPRTGRITIEANRRRFLPFVDTIQVHQGEDTEVDVVLQLESPLDFRPTEEMQRSALDQSTAQRVMAPHTRALDGCIRQGLARGDSVAGSIRIHVGEDGETRGLEVDEPVRPPPIYACVERYVALLVFPALQNGDYATIRYDYTVTNQAARQ